MRLSTGCWPSEKYFVGYARIIKSSMRICAFDIAFTENGIPNLSTRS
jgi:hypothetical protein